MMPPAICWLSAGGGDIDLDSLTALLKRHTRSRKLRMRSLDGSGEELTYELSLKESALTPLVQAVQALPGVESVNLVSYSGELVG